MKLTSFVIMSFFIFQVFVGCQDGSSNGSGSNADQPTANPVPPPAPNPNPKPVANGEWGGEGIEMKVTSTGATYELDCAHGQVKQRMRPNSEGNFHNTGNIS